MKTTVLLRPMLRLLRGDTEPALLEAIDYLMAEARILKRRYPVHVAGCRNVTGWDGELSEATYIIHDRDVKAGGLGLRCQSFARQPHLSASQARVRMVSGTIRLQVTSIRPGVPTSI